ncbi:MAG: hypothetical protein H7Y13_02755 [Sphingobacteriaceae bacterium]|nr:hypothetical protein [Sphingobacteriaceae bacterium]
MSVLPTEKALELERLEKIATEKRIAYEKLDNELFAKNASQDIALLPEYTKAKRELTQAVNDYNTFRFSLSVAYNI